MRSSLIYKLMGAMLLVVILGAIVMAWMTTRATQDAFNLYTTRNGQVWAERMAPSLAEYYASHGGWQDIETYLLSGELTATAIDMQGRGMGRMMGQGYMGGMMDQRLILADRQGNVLADTSGELTGRTLSADQLQHGAAILLRNGEQVGTLLVTSANISGSNSPAGQFLASVNQSMFLSAIMAGLLALVLGTVLFYQITAPLRQLNKAVQAIAAGDLSHRVPIHSRDELGELSQAFNRMTENLELASRQRQHMVADIAHELRTPISVIQANLEGMLDGIVPLDTEQVANLHNETLLLNRLVGDLRLLSQAEAGELKLERQPTDLVELIRAVIERHQIQAQQHEISLLSELPGYLPEVWIDRDRITQVLNNLINNALRYTPEKGTIIVGARPAQGSDSIVVSVTDNGPGIDNKDLPFIFDRFYRADQSRARASGGSGLGLAIVKQLVEAHGGRVEAFSPALSINQVPCGTRISFYLPIYKTP